MQGIVIEVFKRLYCKYLWERGRNSDTGLAAPAPPPLRLRLAPGWGTGRAWQGINR